MPKKIPTPEPEKPLGETVLVGEPGPELLSTSAEEHLTHGGPYCAVPNCGRWAVTNGRCEHHKERDDDR